MDSRMVLRSLRPEITQKLPPISYTSASLWILLLLLLAFCICFLENGYLSGFIVYLLINSINMS